MQIEKLILSIPERWCNISRSHPKNYFLVFGAIFKWNLLKNCNLHLSTSTRTKYIEKSF